MLGPKISLAFQLAEVGYDVWLGNNRGNTYSRSHTILNSDDINYWDFRLVHIYIIFFTNIFK